MSPNMCYLCPRSIQGEGGGEREAPFTPLDTGFRRYDGWVEGEGAAGGRGAGGAFHPHWIPAFAGMTDGSRERRRDEKERRRVFGSGGALL